MPWPRNQNAAGSSRSGLEKAIQEFQDVLSVDQRNELRKINAIPTAADVMTFLTHLDDCSRATTGRRNANKVHTVLESVKDFSAVVDTCVSSHPEIAGLVWGSLKLTIKIVSNITSYFEPLSNVFKDLTNHCPRFGEYQALFSGSIELQNALFGFHASIVRTCTHALQLLQRSLGARLLNSWRTFEQELKPNSDAMMSCCIEVKEQIQLAKIKADHEDQLLQRNERDSAFQMRKKLLKFIPTTNKKMDDIRQAQLDRHSKMKSQHLLEQLSTYDHMNLFKEACNNRLSNTAEWIFSDSQYEKWAKQRSPSLLWCSGKIGSGKTVLAGSVIERVLSARKNPEQYVTHFFIDYRNPESQKAGFIMRSLVRQTLDLAALSPQIETLLTEFHSQLHPTLDDLVQLLLPTIRKVDSFYIFIDALDECEQQERFYLCTCLASLINTEPNVKVYIASREGLAPEISRYFGTTCVFVSMKNIGVTRDIGKFIEDSLQARVKSATLVIGDHSLLDDIRNILRTHTDDEICTHKSDEAILEALQNLPKDLQQTFERALSRIADRKLASQVKRIFPLVAVSERPLKLDELEEALAVNVNLGYIPRSSRVNEIENVATWCENLVQVSDDSKEVSFAHRAIHDFITRNSSGSEWSQFHFDMEEAHHQMGEICITYLSLDCFRTTVTRRVQPIPPPHPLLIAETALMKPGPPSSPSLRHSFKYRRTPLQLDVMEVLSRRRRTPESCSPSHPFLSYAETHWLAHTSRFDAQRSATWDLWRQIIQDVNRRAVVPWSDDQDGEQAALSWGIEHHHRGLVKLLSPPVVDCNKDLLDACSGGFSGDVIQLLCLGADVDHVGQVDPWDSTMPGAVHLRGTRETPLMAACREGNLAIIECLISYGANTRVLVDDGGSGAISSACCSGQLEIVEKLLDYMKLQPGGGGDIMGTKAGARALHEACAWGDWQMVQRLIWEGARVTQDPSLVHVAAQRGNLAIASLLLEAGKLDLGYKSANHGYRTALEVANDAKSAPVARLIRQHTGQVEETDVEREEREAKGFEKILRERVIRESMRDQEEEERRMAKRQEEAEDRDRDIRFGSNPAGARNDEARSKGGN